MQRREYRGIIVYVASQGESSKRIGIYTEKGMIYFTLYGAKSSKKHLKSACSLFTMGRFIFSIVRGDIHRFVDVQIYDNGHTLSQNIEVYYAACTGAELVKNLVGAEHKKLFKDIVDFQLFLTGHTNFNVNKDDEQGERHHIEETTKSHISNKQCWKEATIVFMWRSLESNGWQPEVQLQKVLPSTQVRYVSHIGFVEATTADEQSGTHSIEYVAVEQLYNSNTLLYREAIEKISQLALNTRDNLLEQLFNIWKHILGYELTMAQFVIH